MRASAAAKRYARALFSLARETDGVESVRAELSAMGDLLDANPPLSHSLFRPLHPVAERRALLAAVCERLGSSGPVRNFYAFLVDQRRLVVLPAIREEYARLADEAAGRTRAEVVSASLLSDAQRERLRAVAAQGQQRGVCHASVDSPGLYGCGDVYLDAQRLGQHADGEFSGVGREHHVLFPRGIAEPQ